MDRFLNSTNKTLDIYNSSISLHRLYDGNVTTALLLPDQYVSIENVDGYDGVYVHDLLSGGGGGNLSGDITGNLFGKVVGDLVGDVTGNLYGNVFGDVFGNVTGNLNGDVTGNIYGSVIDLSHTDLLDIGSNTHSDIDDHISSTSNPHSVTLNQITPTNTNGDLIVENMSGVARLPVGSNNQVLSANSGTSTGLEWIDNSGGDLVGDVTGNLYGSVIDLSHTELDDVGSNTHSQIDDHIGSSSNPHSVSIDQVTPTTTKGDLLVENGSNVVRLPVGSDNQVLSANSGESSGLEWIDNSSGGGGSAPLVFNYQWSLGTSNNPGTSVCKINSTNISSANSMYINITDQNSNDLSDIFDSLGTDGYIRITKADDSTISSVFSFDNAIDLTTYYRFYIDYLGGTSGSNSQFGNNGDVLVSFQKNGADGADGADGLLTPQGCCVTLSSTYVITSTGTYTVGSGSSTENYSVPANGFNISSMCALTTGIISLDDIGYYFYDVSIAYSSDGNTSDETNTCSLRYRAGGFGSYSTVQFDNNVYAAETNDSKRYHCSGVLYNGTANSDCKVEFYLSDDSDTHSLLASDATRVTVYRIG